MTDAAEKVLVRGLKRRFPHNPDVVFPGEARAILADLLSLASDGFPRRVVLEQEAEGEPVKVRLLDEPWPLGSPGYFLLIDPDPTCSCESPKPGAHAQSCPRFGMNP